MDVEKIKAFIIEELINDPKVNDLGMTDDIESYIDSLLMVQLISFVEDEYGVDLLTSDVDVTEFRTLKGIAGVIDKELNKVK